MTNCVLLSAASALKLGTESWGDFRHCVFSNCVIRQARTGIALLAKDGGTMEDVRFQNITMETQPKWGKGVEWPIEFDIERRTEKSRLSHIRDVSLSDISMVTKGRVLIEGMPASLIDTLTMRNVIMRITGYETSKTHIRVAAVTGGLAMLSISARCPRRSFWPTRRMSIWAAFMSSWPEGGGRTHGTVHHNLTALTTSNMHAPDIDAAPK